LWVFTLTEPITPGWASILHATSIKGLYTATTRLTTNKVITPMRYFKSMLNASPELGSEILSPSV